MAAALIDRGIPDVRPLLGGLDAWEEAGLPLDTFAESVIGVP